MLPGHLLDERYRLEAEAGSGGMGTVWRARDTRIGRTVAIKVLHSHLGKDENLRERFDREARLIGALQHPAVAQLYDFTETTVDGNQTAYLVMEYVAGSSLLARLTDHGPMAVQPTLTLIASAAEGLHAAHRHGIVHRDVKPGNILVTEDGTAKIVDFGISQSFGDRKLTVTGHFMGSLHYVSPEQLRGDALTPVSDVYSLGVVAYEALTGDLPFPGDTPASVLNGHLQLEPRPLPGTVPAPVAALIMRALAKEPADRYASAADFAAACRALRDDTDLTMETPIPATIRPGATLSPTSRYPSIEPAPEPRRRRRFIPVLIVLLALALAAAGGGVTWFLTNDGDGALDADTLGLAELKKMEPVGDPVPFGDSRAADRGAVPEPVTDGERAFFVHNADTGPEAIAVDLASGKEKWRAPLDQPTGGALRAGRNLLYTADVDQGIVNFLDPDTGDSLNVVDLDGRIGVTTLKNRLLLTVEGSDEVTAYNADGSEAWREGFDEAVVDVDVEAQWKNFTNQPGRFSTQTPKRLYVYGQDGTVWRLAADTGDTVDEAEPDSDLRVTAAFEGMVFTADPDDDGYTVVAYDVERDYEEVGRWEDLRPGYQPAQLEWCGQTRICVKDRRYGTEPGAIVLDFTDSGSEPLWQSSGKKSVADIYAAGDTTAVVQGKGESRSTQLYDDEFEPLGRPKTGVFRPIDGKTFLDYPRTGGSATSNPVGKHFFTGLDAGDGSTRDLGTHEVFPQCVTDGSRIACPTPRGITVWEYRDAR